MTLLKFWNICSTFSHFFCISTDFLVRLRMYSSEIFTRASPGSSLLPYRRGTGVLQWANIKSDGLNGLRSFETWLTEAPISSQILAFKKFFWEFLANLEYGLVCLSSTKFEELLRTKIRRHQSCYLRTSHLGLKASFTKGVCLYRYFLFCPALHMHNHQYKL